MTTSLCKNLLDELRSDDSGRARLVESLRCASALLTETEIEMSHEARATVAAKVAIDLKAVAQRLCDHATMRGDRCKYCDLWIEPPV